MMLTEQLQVWDDRAGRPVVSCGNMRGSGNTLADALRNLADRFEAKDIRYPNQLPRLREQKGPSEQ